MTTPDPIAREMEAFDAKFDHINSREGGALICDPSCEQEYNLADVLRAVDLVTDDRNEFQLSINSSGMFMNGDTCCECVWNLSLNFDGQSDECKQFIGGLLGVK